MFFLTGSDLNNLVESHNRELSLLSTWLKDNKLSLNIQKTYFVIFHREKLKIPENPQTVLFNKFTLSKINCIKYIGVILDSKIALIQHLAYVKKYQNVLGSCTKYEKFLLRKILLTCIICIYINIYISVSYLPIRILGECC